MLKSEAFFYILLQLILMEETFDTYEKRPLTYTIILFVVLSFYIFIFTCILFPSIISKAPQLLMVCFMLIGLITTILLMFIGFLSIKTYIKNGEITLTDSSIIINGNKYFLTDLLSVETFAGTYKGRGSRGGVSDGTGSKIIITTNKNEILKKKFVVISKDQRDTLTSILKYWRTMGFKIMSNGIDLI